MHKIFKNKLSKKQIQWLWFIILWCSSFITTYMITYIIKLAIKSI